MAYGTNIIVVPPQGSLNVYPCQPGDYYIVGTDFTYPKIDPVITCIDYDARDFVPSFAFSNDTIILCHNGTNHFWSTAMSSTRSPEDWDRLRRACPLPVHDVQAIDEAFRS